MVVLYPSGVLEAIFHIILILILFAYVLLFKPAKTAFWKYEQIGIHFFLLLVQILMTVLLFDDDRMTMSGKSRWRMGYAVAFFIFFIFLWNMLVLLYKLFEFMTKCKAASMSVP